MLRQSSHAFTSVQDMLLRPHSCNLVIQALSMPLTFVVSPFSIASTQTLLAALTPVPPTTFDSYPVKSSGLGFEGYLRGSLDIKKP
jgi:hypothetical protein